MLEKMKTLNRSVYDISFYQTSASTNFLKLLDTTVKAS
jgi:hypothetical protein